MSLSAIATAGATLACLPQMTPTRLQILMAHDSGPEGALAEIRAGRAAKMMIGTEARGTSVFFNELALRWRLHADPEPIRQRLNQRNTQVWIAGEPDYPIVDAVPDRPAVLFGEGNQRENLLGLRVAVVGTRAATPHGLADAYELGGYLAGAGVTVVSGLAIGIDAAAQQGALVAGGVVIGVVATGLDVVYPRRHALLFEQVRASGAIIGEQGFGVGPRRELFPIRNRIIAALADIVVVVEATISGGARITAQYALDYDRTVLAVPGSRRNAAAAGTNALIADGAHPLLDWEDVLLALGLRATRHAQLAKPKRIELSVAGKSLMRALGGEAATLDQLISRSGLAAATVAVEIRDLERHGWIVRAQGAIWPQ